MRKKRKKWLIIFACALGLLLAISIGAIQYTSTSGFCAACHYMKPYFESWETSSHKDAKCSACHYPPGGGIQGTLRKKIEGLVMVGRYWTKLYVRSKPWAEIKDESCLQEGCHDKRLLEGMVPFKTVVFDHKIHFEDLRRGKRLQCTSCHSQIVQGEHITVTESSCFICHFKESEFFPQIDDCAHCHTQQTLTSAETSRYNHALVYEGDFTCHQCHSNTIMGDGEVPRETCYKCHMERERLDKFDDTDLMHEEHIFDDKIECNECHMEIQHKIIKDIDHIADCRTCHTDYHQAQKTLYIGEGGKGIDHAMPNIMLDKGLSCKGCHIFHEEAGGKLIKSETFVSEAKACESCHGKGFDRIMREWEASTTKKLGQIRAIYNRTAREIRRSKHTNQKRAAEQLEEAYFNIELVDAGKSVHNVSYSQELLLAAYNKMKDALSTIESRYKPPSFALAPEGIPTECYNCHTGIEEINTAVFGLDFPHKKHLIEQQIACDTCHSNVRTHGEFVATKSSCAVCHHKETDKDCTSCHSLQTTFYQGGSIEGHTISQDIMFEAGAGCTDCHLNDEDAVFRSDKEKCLDCHEEGYEDMFTEWQSSVKAQVQSLYSSLKEKGKLKLTDQDKQTLRDIRRTLQKIELDGSAGIHNYASIDEVLSDMKKKIESIG